MGGASRRVAGADADLDVAVLEVDTGEIEPVQRASADDQPGVGRPVLALGNPVVAAYV